MSKIYFSIIYFLFFIPLKAQITVTLDDMKKLFEVGKSLNDYVYNEDSIQFDIGYPSNTVSQNWVMPSLIFNDSIKYQLDNPSTGFANSFYLDAKVVAKTNFFTEDSNSIFAEIYLDFQPEGVKLIGRFYLFENLENNESSYEGKIENQLLFYKLPLALGFTHTEYNIVSDDPGNGYRFTKYSTSKCDAFGTIKIGQNSYPCLRVYSIMIDSVITPTETYIDKRSRIEFFTKNGMFLLAEPTRSWINDSGKVYTYYIEKLSNETSTNVNFSNINNAKSFLLHQNFPNPFNPQTKISYELNEDSKVSLKVFNILGKEVANLVDEKQKRGKHSINFEAENLPSGSYFYRLLNNKNVKTGKMMLVK